LKASSPVVRCIAERTVWELLNQPADGEQFSTVEDRFPSLWNSKNSAVRCFDSIAGSE
jgi:hypothetical protein